MEGDLKAVLQDILRFFIQLLQRSDRPVREESELYLRRLSIPSPHQLCISHELCGLKRHSGFNVAKYNEHVDTSLGGK